MYSPDSYRPRILDAKLDLYLSAVGAVLITGPRFTGKTTTGQAHSASEISLADSANNFSNRRLAMNSPDFALKGELPRLIDEWQEVPQIWDAVRFSCDSDNKFGKYLLTGSSLATLDEGDIFHSGTGRIATLTLQSMTLFETGDSSGLISLRDLFDHPLETTATGKVEIEELVRFCVRGGWPKSIDVPLAASSITPSEYMRKVIEEDFPRLVSSKGKSPTGKTSGRKTDISKVRAVVRALASLESTASSVTGIREKVAEDSDYALGRNTIPSYIDTLSKLFIVYEQPAYAFPISKRSGSKLLKSPKLRFSDPSLAIASLGLSPDNLLRDMDLFAKFFDCLCFHDLKIYAESWDAKIYHLLEEHGTAADSLIELKDGRIGIFRHVVGIDEMDRAVQHLSRINKMFTSVGMNPSLLCIVCGMADAAYNLSAPDGTNISVVPLTALKP